MPLSVGVTPVVVGVVGASVGPYGAHHTLKKVLGLHSVGGTSLLAGSLRHAAQTEVEVGVEVDPERTENRVMGRRRTLRLSGGMEVKGGQLGVHRSQMIVSAGTV